MLALIVYLTGLFNVVICVIAAAYDDFKTLKISNKFSISIVASYFGVVTLLMMFSVDAPLPSLSSSLLAALLMFLITFVLFATKLLGAADSKIATAVSLWLGMQGLVPFLVYMTVAGGVLAIISLVLRKTKKLQGYKDSEWIKQINQGHSRVPYGIAIAIGVLASFCFLGYLSSETFISFM